MSHPPKNTPLKNAPVRSGKTLPGKTLHEAEGPYAHPLGLNPESEAELSVEEVDEVVDAQLAALLAPRATVSHKKRRTFHDMVHKPRGGRKTAYTFRELCSALHIASESLRAAKKAPGRLTLLGVLALSDLLNEEPLSITADLFAEIRATRNSAALPSANARTRIGKQGAAPAIEPRQTSGHTH